MLILDDVGSRDTARDGADAIACTSYRPLQGHKVCMQHYIKKRHTETTCRSDAGSGLKPGKTGDESGAPSGESGCRVRYCIDAGCTKRREE
jgi:hypothetical protein